VSGGKDQRVLLWNVAPRHEAIQIANAEFSRPVFSPDGKRLLTHVWATNGWESRVFDAAHSLIKAEPGYALGFSEDSREVVYFDEPHAALAFTSATNSGSSREIRLGLQETAFAVSQITANGRWFFCLDRDGIASVWSVAGQRVARFPTLKPPIRAAKLSPDARWLAVSVERDYDLHLYEVPSGALRKLTGHRDHVSGLEFSPDARLVATGSVDADVRVFETLSGHLRATLSGHLEEASDVAFSPDGRTLASVGTGSALKLWHVPTWREVASLPMPRAAMALAFSPEGRRLAISRRDQVLEILEAP
jgi:WD40 repeat protein